MFVSFETVQLLCPELILVAMASWIYIAGAFQQSRAWWTLFALIVYAVVAAFMSWSEATLWRDLQEGGILLSGPLIIDVVGHALRWLALLVGVLFTLIAARSSGEQLTSEFLATLMLLVVGLMLVARANDLVLLFVSLELVSIPTYVLLYLGRRDRANSEAAVKYFFLSTLSSALLLYGVSFLYGISGTATMVAPGGEVSVQNPGLAAVAGDSAVLVDALTPLALVLLLAGFGFKIAAVPFHFYAPDVYQGTSNANAGLLAVAPKIAGIVAIIRLLVIAVPLTSPFAWQLVTVLAMLTMTIGNVCALWQNNIRRLLAYSSIAHAGYMLIGLAVAFTASEGGADPQGIGATLFYLVVYVLASAGTFAALTYLGGGEREVSGLDELAGLGRDRPAAGAVLAICMFSLAGIPPLAGFWGKFALFTSAISAATGSSTWSVNLWFTVLAITGALNAAVAAAYYLRVVAMMYFRPTQKPLAADGGYGAWVAMCGCGLLLVAVGAFPGPLAAVSRLAEFSAQSVARGASGSPASPRLSRIEPLARDEQDTAKK